MGAEWTEFALLPLRAPDNLCVYYARSFSQSVPPEEEKFGQEIKSFHYEERKSIEVKVRRRRQQQLWCWQ